jgi:hypothetical protein
MTAVLLGSLLGLIAGVRHAFEPDHVAAVTTMAAGERRASRVVRFATSWGLGHGLMLVAVGGALFALRSRMPDRAADILELFVAAALVALGVRAVILAKRAGSRADGALSAPLSTSLLGLPFVVGIVHGLSGSGALTALAVTKAATIAQGLLFMSVYAGGAVLGMVALAGVLGLPLARLAKKPLASRAVVAVSGIVSLAVGVAWAWPIVQRL